jgi:uncharacterized membrane protein YGL010W
VCAADACEDTDVSTEGTTRDTAASGSTGHLMEMLTGYAAAHQHPVNIAVHMAGIPTIMLGVLIPLQWVVIASPGGVELTLAHVLIAGFAGFYLTLDVAFALTFLAGALLLSWAASWIAGLGTVTAASIAAAMFFGGYAAQFIGHAIEKSVPVLVRHPLQANLAAPFFTVVELFKLAGLRSELFDQVQQRVALRREREQTSL